MSDIEAPMEREQAAPGRSGARASPRFPWPETPTTAIVARTGVLGPLWRRIIRALAETLFDRGDGVPSGRLDWTEEEADQLVAAASLVPRITMKLALLAIQWLPILVLLRFTRFTSLRPTDRNDYLQRLERHRIPFFGLPVMALKIVVGSVYYEHPDALPETGYDGHNLKGPVPW